MLQGMYNPRRRIKYLDHGNKQRRERIQLYQFAEILSWHQGQSEGGRFYYTWLPFKLRLKKKSVLHLFHRYHGCRHLGR